MAESVSRGIMMDRTGKGMLAALCLIAALVGLMIAPYAQFYGALLAIVGIVAFVLLFIDIAFVRTDKERKAQMLERWEDFRKTGHLIVNENLALVKGERIIFGITPCYMESESGGFSYFARDVIVTNQRIALGFPVAIFFMPIKESFGKMNIWFSEKLKKEESGALGALGGDSIASSVKVIEKDGEKILDVEMKLGPLKIYYKFYHPEAERIEALYLKARR